MPVVPVVGCSAGRALDRELGGSRLKGTHLSTLLHRCIVYTNIEISRMNIIISNDPSMKINFRLIYN